MAMVLVAQSDAIRLLVLNQTRMALSDLIRLLDLNQTFSFLSDSCGSIRPNRFNQTLIAISETIKLYQTLMALSDSCCTYNRTLSDYWSSISPYHFYHTLGVLSDPLSCIIPLGCYQLYQTHYIDHCLSIRPVQH